MSIEFSALLCSFCFADEGLRQDAEKVGIDQYSACPNCGEFIGRKLDRYLIDLLALRFFVYGSMHRCEYGAAPVIQYNQYQKTKVNFPDWLQNDIKLFEKILNVGFFYYGPRLWILGHIEPLSAMLDESSRPEIFRRVIEAFPIVEIKTSDTFYRIRKNPDASLDLGQYDSPPEEFLGKGRFDSLDLPCLYASSSVDICIHESRVTVEDELYLCTLVSSRNLKILDLTAEIVEDGNITEFESLELAIRYMFLAGDPAYETIRALAIEASRHGFDGIKYFSYFSILNSGVIPYPDDRTALKQNGAKKQRLEENSNIVIFGRPIRDGRINVKCINRIRIDKVKYDYHFGPAFEQ